jgi:serine/threonine protein kinase
LICGNFAVKTVCILFLHAVCYAISAEDGKWDTSISPERVHMVDYIGQRLGNYQLTRLLGEGGFAQVYLGEHIYLSTQAAIKVLSTQVANDTDWFRTEARTIARLVHPNIVRVLEFGVEGSTPFLVMDYAPSGTLRQRHPKGTRLPLATVTSYVQQVAEALQYAHSEKLVHRDVKPENMLVGRNNEILLSDFGIALIAQTMGDQGIQNVAGTLPYTAPEQIQGKPRQASDQYSLAIVAYEWLVGERPFNGSLTEVISQQLAVAPPSLCASVPTIPPAAEQVILTALEKDPDKRFSNIRAFALALKQTNQLDTSSQQANQRIAVDLATATILPSSSFAASVANELSVVKPLESPPARLEPIRSVQGKSQAAPAGTVIARYREHSNVIRSLSWLVDGKRIVSVSSEKTVHVWEATTGKKQQIYPDASDAARLVARSADGSLIATAGSDALIRVWNFTTNQLIGTYRGHQGQIVNAIAWSPAQQLLASAATDGTVHVWDANTGQPLTIYRGHTGSVATLAWSPSEAASPPGSGLCIVSGGDDASIQTWEATTGKTIALYRNQPAKVLSVGWSPSVYTLSPGAPTSSRVGCGRADGMIQMWDTTANQEVLSYRYPAPVSVVAWSPDGKRFAYAGENKMIEVWDTTTNRKLLTFAHAAPPRAMVWSPDGKYIASGGDDTIIQVWVAP